MASLNSVQTRQALSRGYIKYIADDQGVAIRLAPLAAAGAVTSVTVTTATNIVIIDSVGTKTYAFATYTTVGALADAINADGRFEAKVLDTLRSKATATQFVDGAITVSNGYYDVLVDTSAAKYLAIRLTFDRQAGKAGSSYKLRDGHRVNLQEIVTNVTAGGGAQVFSVYETTPASRGNVETSLTSMAVTSGSAKTINWAGGNGKITGGEGNDLVVLMSDATSLTGSLQISGIIE